ncbi:hypothetical protein BJ742DRAFT_131894 [Cladochytrium replicatum]|nr:hypothetical protein BJ742DRAFT_131894 [Cladochytrium replicatum]
MHGDEPLDGPDAYYLLKDLNTPNFLTAMMDDTDLQLNCIVRIDGDPEKPSSTTKRFRIPYSNFGTNNALIAHVRKQYDAAPDDSLWRQCGWINVDLAKVYVSNLADSRNQDNPKGLGSNTSSASGGGVPDPKQLVFDHVAKRIYCVLETRKMYEEYFDRTLQVHVPSMYALSPPDMRYYEHVLESVPAECSAQPEVLVALMLEHLMNSMDEEGGAGALAGVEVGDELGALQRLFEGAASRLLEVVPKAREEVDVDPVTNAQDAVESKPVNTENLTDRRSIM